MQQIHRPPEVPSLKRNRGELCYKAAEARIVTKINEAFVSNSVGATIAAILWTGVTFQPIM